MPPLVSVIIVNWNTRDLLRACLASLPAGGEGCRLEPVVVDNGSTDGSADMVAAAFPSAALLRNSANVGFVAANNQGLRAATGDYLFMLNSDTELRPGAIAALVAVADRPEVGAAGPRLLNSDGTWQDGYGPFPRLWHRFLPGWGEARYRTAVEARLAAGDATAAVDWLQGAAVLARREVVAAVGPLDERFFMWYDDLDWSRRVAAAGLERRLVPAAEVVHHSRQSAAKVEVAALNEQLLTSEYLYLRLHHGRTATLTAMLLRVVKALARWAIGPSQAHRQEAARRLAWHWRAGPGLGFGPLPPPCTAPVTGND